MQFPNVKGANLERKEFALPADLEGEYNIVVIAFDIAHQRLVDAWQPSLAELAARYPMLRYYELPALPNYDRFRQMIVDGWMRNGIPDRAVRERTITLYIKLAPFLSALGIGNTQTIHTLLLDRAGTVVWRAAGAFSPDKLASLSDILTSTIGEPTLKGV